MGHVRLGSLPRSRAWKEVVGLITAGADVSQIANATIRAADKAFTFVLNDEGFTEAVWLMTQPLYVNIVVVSFFESFFFRSAFRSAGLRITVDL